MQRLPLPVVVLIIFVPIAILGVVLFTAPAPPANGTSKTSTTSLNSSTTGTETVTQTASPLATLRYAAIRNNDTIVLFDLDSQPVVINLEQKQWQDLQWAPDGKSLAVLSNSGTRTQPVFNLHLFTPEQNSWRQLTTYSADQTGITGYAWWNEQTLAYTQGDGVNKWLHHFDVLNNNVKKIFTTSTELRATSQAQRYIHKASNQDLWQLLSPQGRVEFEFTPAKASIDTLQEVNFQAVSTDVWLRGTQQEKQVILSWSLNSPTFTQLYKADNQNLIGACFTAGQLLAATHQQATLQAGIIKNNQLQNQFNFNFNRDLSNLESKVACSVAGAFIQVVNNQESFWWQFSAIDGIKELSAAQNASGVAVKPLVAN